MIDSTDKKILKLLERDGRLSFNSISEEIHLSKTPIWTRVQSLEKRQVINGYRAEIDPEALDLHLQAFVQARVSSSMQKEFEAAVMSSGCILACYATTGEADYLLHVIVKDVSGLDVLVRQHIAAMPGVKGLFTIIGLKAIKQRGYLMDAV